MEDQMQQQEQQPEEMEQQDRQQKAAELEKAITEKFFDENLKEGLATIEKYPRDEREKQWQNIADILLKENKSSFQRSLFEAAWHDNDLEGWAVNQNEIDAISEIKALKKIIAEAAPSLQVFIDKDLEELCIKVWGDIKLDVESTLFAPLNSEENPMEIFKKLSRYIVSEALENQEKYRDADATSLILEAAKKAREDGQEIPVLELEEKYEKEQRRRKRISETRKKNEQLKNDVEGITPIGNLPIITDKNFYGVIKGYSAKHTPQNRENVFGENGKFLYSLTGNGQMVENLEKELKNENSLHNALLSYLLCFELLIQQQEKNGLEFQKGENEDCLIPIHLPSFFKDTKIDARPRKRDNETHQLTTRNTDEEPKELRLKKFAEFLTPFKDIVIRFEDSYYAAANFHHYDANTEIVYVTAPYCHQLAYSEAINRKIAKLFDPSVLSCDKTAFDIACRIAGGIIRRGGVKTPDESTYKADAKRKPLTRTTTDKKAGKIIKETFAPDIDTETKDIITEKKLDDDTTEKTVEHIKKNPHGGFTFSISFDTLINECPQMQDAILAIKRDDKPNKARRINDKLKSVFEAAVKIITEKSVMPQYYTDFEIVTDNYDTFKAPTSSTLKSKLVVHHHGKNSKCKHKI